MGGEGLGRRIGALVGEADGVFHLFLRPLTHGRELVVGGQARLAEPVLEASIVKDLGTVWEQALPARARELAAFAETDALFARRLAYAINIAPKLTIQGGTSEVLRGIIARGLCLR